MTPVERARHQISPPKDLTPIADLPKEPTMAGPSTWQPESPAVVWRRRLVGLLILFVLVIAGAYALDYYRVWRYQHLLKYADAAAARKDWAGVQFSLRQAMQISPGNIEPVEKLADYAEKLSPLEAVHWRRTVASMEPTHLRHRLNWARAALNQGNIASAYEAVTGMAPASRNTGPFQLVQSQIALAAGSIEAAEAAAAEAVHLDPKNETNRFHLATVQLLSTNEAKRAVGRRHLENAVKRPEFSLEAHRSLAAQSLAQKDAAAARRWMEPFLNRTDLSLTDELRLLELLRLEKSPDLATRLGNLQRRVVTNAEPVVIVARWMNSRGYARETLAWMDGLSTNLVRLPVLRTSRLEAHQTLKSWKECAAWLKADDWGGDDFLRLSLLARVYRQSGSKAEADAAWKEAVAKSSPTPAGRRALYQAAAEVGWREESLALLELAASAPTDTRWALMELFDYFSGVPDAHKMLDISRRLLALDPEDQFARNNVAALSLLLKDETERALQLARDAYASRPQDPAILSTYGYALLVNGQPTEALKIFERIPAKYAGHPSIAVYYAAVLTANGQINHARRYMTAADGARILPEEKELLAETLRRAAAVPTDL
jgi:tetratricopeptide (TPR) repeat protein